MADGAGEFFIVRAGSLVAWRAGGRARRAFRIVGAHTDSPNLRVKQHPDRFVSGWQVVALQPYGGAWLNSWLDRDLGISGRLSVRSADGLEHRLIRIDEPILRVPQLAIHLAEDRKSVSLDPQRHVNAVWGVGSGARSFVGLRRRAGRSGRGRRAGFRPDDARPDAVDAGRARTASWSVRRDWTTSAAATRASRRFWRPSPSNYLPVLALFDHEEVGSQSDHGAQSELLPTVLERIALAAGGGREDFLRRLPGSMVASGDMAHATHPNYPERHEPGHLIEVNAGPVLKVQPNLRYATDGRTAAAFALACRQAGVPLQRYEHRADLPCGSTIGPMTVGAYRHPDGGCGRARSWPCTRHES